MFILFFSDNTNIPNLKRAILKVLTSQHAALCRLCTHNLKAFADEMFSVHLLSEEVHRSPTFNGIIDEFKSAMAFMREYSQLNDHCAKLLSVFTALGGSFIEAASYLREEWIKVGIELNVN